MAWMARRTVGFHKHEKTTGTISNDGWHGEQWDFQHNEKDNGKHSDSLE